MTPGPNSNCSVRQHLYRDAARFRARHHDRDGLRVAVGIDQEHRGVMPRRHGVGQRHRFRSGGGLIQQRRVRDRQAGQVGHHRLEVEERFQATLGDLGLVRCIGGVPAGILQDIPLDHLGHERAVIPHADVRAEDPVLVGHAAQCLQHLALASPRWQVQRTAQANVLGHYRVDEVIKRLVAQQLHHLGHIFLPRPDVTIGKVIRVHDLERRHPMGANLVCRIGGIGHGTGGGTLGSGHAMRRLQLVKNCTMSDKKRPGQNARSAVAMILTGILTRPAEPCRPQG